MIILALVAMVYVNRDVKIPASNYFVAIIAIMLLLTVISAFNYDIDMSGFYHE